MTYSSDEADENQQMNVTATSNDSDSDEGQDNDDVTSQQSMEVDESVQEEEEEEESSLVPSQESPFNEEGDEDGDSEDNGDDDDGGDDDNEDNEDAHDDNEDAHDDNEDADMDSDDEEEEVNTDKVTNFDTTGSILETSMDIDDNDQSNDEHDNDQSNDDPNNKADASEEEDDSNMENGDSNGNDADASILNVAAAASGKVLIRPSNMTSDDDDNDDNDEDIEETLNGNSHNKDEAIDTSLDQEKPSPTDDNVIAATEESEVTGVTETSTPIQPAVLSGKPLALAVAAIDDDSSSDDELLMSHKTTKVKKSTTRKASTSTKKKASTPSSKSTKKRKKRTVTAVAEVVEDDAIEAVAVVGDGSDSDTVEAVVIPQAPPKKKRKKPGPKPKKKPNDGKKTTSKKKPTVVDKGKSKKKKSSNGNDSDSDGSCYAASVIPHERMRAAETAREILMNSVQRTPFVMSESHTVRNFGRIKIEEKNTLETSYCNAAAIYPVGFSCDRYEFSPVHGRFLKLRCDILDGETDDKSKESNTSKNENGNKKKGPIFRIMWGRGIDEIDSLQTFPFDLYSSSTPIVNQVDAVAVPAGKDVVKIKPEQGMRVKVRFENNLWYLGNILQVSVKKQSKGSDKKSTRAAASSKKDKKPKYDVQIMYDNGVIEDITFPDPDIVLVAPGANDVADGCLIDVKEVRGKPVNTVLGTTPLLAWAKTLTKLGLIDEIIYEKAVQSISHARNEGLAEFKKQRQHLKKDFNGASEVGNSPGKKSKSDTAEKETLLRQRLDELSKEYEEQLSKSQATAIELAEARLQSLGPFYTNPFFNSDTSINQQKQWLTTIIKKEKSKIGSTGNKRKIVTATDLLERTATFYNIDIERLLEGLPGSEFCPGYVFHSLRSSASSALALIHEEQVRREKEKQKTKSKAPKAKKVTKDVKAELIDEREKELKRKARDDEREERKKQRLEEMDQVKKEREFNRLTRLSTQIDEKLFKESCTQRERVTFLATKLIGKEIARRRKAAEIVVSHSIGNTIEVQSNYKKSHCRLPTLSSIYHPDVVRLWNFLTTFKGAFDNLDSTDVPSLEKLQEIIDILNNRETDKDLQRKARAMLTKIAVALCTPMTKSLIKTLSSALASALQDNKGDKVDEDAQSAVSVENDPDSFPIDENTWKEFARLTFITDALSDLGYTKIEQTHIIRGHRTGGHPNSKEAKRVKRGEDFALVLRRQALTESDSQKDLNPYEVKVTIPSPCQPSATPSDWVYYLHNVKSLPSNAATGIKSNLKKALSLLKSATYLGDERDGIEKALQRNISLLEGIGTTVTAPTETINICKNVHQDILGILDSATAEHQSQKDKIHPSESSCNQKKNTRLRAGVYAHLNLSEETYKKLKISKENYISNAIKLKEDRERKKKRTEEGDDDDDDDDDDDEEGKEEDTSNQNNNVEEEERIGKETEYDEFCADEPKAPELLRRCLAVLRSLCLTAPAETFLYPVDPRANIKYYDSIVRPMSLYDVGKFLQKEAKRLESTRENDEVEAVVAQFARKVRLICKNCSIYSSVGAAVISTAEEMIRIFERLFFDWVLSPKNILPPLNTLDDDRCVIFHPSDEDSVVLVCDGCEGKFNMSRLEPPLTSVPKGDWYCHRCRGGYCWSSVDERIGKRVSKRDRNLFGIINSCEATVPESPSSKASLSYTVRYRSGLEENWTLNEIDDALEKAGTPASKISCLEAVAESPGYGCGINNGLILEATPIALNPLISDAAAQQAITSTVFKDTILASAALLVNEVDAITSSEWLKILVLLSMKCATTVKMQEFTNKIENESYTGATSTSQKEAKVKPIKEVIPKLLDDTFDSSDGEEEESNGEKEANEAKVVENKEETKVVENNEEIKVAEKTEDKETKVTENKEDKETTVTENKEDKEAKVTENKGDKETNVLEQKEGTTSGSAGELTSSDAQQNVVNDAELLEKQRKKELYSAMRERQKARENSILAHYIQKHIKSAISSFAEDNVTRVINSYLSVNNMGSIDFSSSSCKSLKCSMCGLSDVALATPLVRCPNQSEWFEHLTCSLNGHKSFLIADFGVGSDEKDNGNSEDNKNTNGVSKLASVVVRVDGDVISVKADSTPTSNEEMGIVNFLPKNKLAFQAELKARYEDGLPFVVGSLATHECCALAAHKARIDKLLQEDKETTASIIERDFGNNCGRTLALGCDADGRWYWKFNSEPESLFISIEENGQKSFHKFSTAESIASVIKSLAKHPLSNSIRRAYPKASLVLDNGTWSDLLQKKGFEHVFEQLNKQQEHETEVEKVTNELGTVEVESQCYVVGEDVLIEAETEQLLWDAKIIAVKQNDEGKIQRYKVHYKEWSSRFDEWVEKKRVIEPSDNNIMAQEKLLEKMIKEKAQPPLSLEQLKANKFLDSPNRASSFAPLMDFKEILRLRSSDSTCDNVLSMMRCATLMIEAALPTGSVNTSIDGEWNLNRSSYWRSLVRKAENPGSLMGCIILLENVLSKDWLRPNADHLLSCLPRPWKAINDATASSIALRLCVLDRGIKYGLSYDEDGEEWTNIDDDGDE